MLLGVRGNGAEISGTLLLPVLLPGKEEEGFVLAVIDLGDPDRSAEGTAIVVLLIDVFWQAIEVLKPFFSVQILIAENVVSGPVKLIRARLCREALDAASGAAELGRHGRCGDLELLQRFHGRRRLVKCGTTVCPRRTRAIQNHFIAEVLPASKLGLESAAAAISASRPNSSRRNEHEGLRGAKMALTAGVHGEW